jgi:hypothetical protein
LVNAPPTGREFDTETLMNYGPTFDEMVRRLIALAIFGSASFAFLAQGANHSFAEEQMADGSSSKRLRSQTIQSLPYHLLNQQTQNKINEVLQKPSVYRRLPVTSINADPDYFRFLTRYPEVIVSIWQLMGITNMTTDRTGPFTISTNDGAGTISELELIYGDQNLHIFYGKGTYEGPILKRTLSGRCVLVLKTENSAQQDGTLVTTSQLDVFLKIDNATAGWVAKTIQPLVGSTADHNFIQSLKFVQRLNETTAKNGPGVQHMGTRLDISTDVRQKFNDVVNLVFQRAVNASVPDDVRSTARPASLESRSLAPPQPSRNLNAGETLRPGYAAPPSQAPAFENLRDTGRNYQYQPQTIVPASYSTGLVEPRPSGYPSMRFEDHYDLPPRSNQPLRYVVPPASRLPDRVYPDYRAHQPSRFDPFGRPLGADSETAGWQRR